VVLHHKEHFGHFIIVNGKTELRGCPKPGRVANEGNAESNPLDLFLVAGPRMLTNRSWAGAPKRESIIKLPSSVFDVLDAITSPDYGNFRTDRPVSLLPRLKPPSTVGRRPRSRSLDGTVGKLWRMKGAAQVEFYLFDEVGGSSSSSTTRTST
jgi:hypothetical protein